MEKSPRPAQLESTIREIIHELLEMPVTPHVRELRAKAVTYGRVINNWAVYPPTAPQVQAMLECVTELHEKVFSAKREVSKVSRRPSAGASPMPSVPPAGVAWNANVADTSGVRVRKSTNPGISKQDSPTRPPPAISEAPSGSVPPVSAQRAVAGDTPVPALLRTRRSR